MKFPVGVYVIDSILLIQFLNFAKGGTYSLEELDYSAASIDEQIKSRTIIDDLNSQIEVILYEKQESQINLLLHNEV